MDKHYTQLIINEIKNFKKLQKMFSYKDLDDLIAHYIEEGVINSKEELISILKAIKKRIDILVNSKTFNAWWIKGRSLSK